MKIGKFEVVSQMQRTAKELSNVCCISIFPVKLFILPVVLKNGAEIYHGDRNLLISKKVSGCAGIEFVFSACDNEAKSRFVPGIKSEKTRNSGLHVPQQQSK